MLTDLCIENFKSLRKLELQIKDLTILIGPNNSGKTSVFQTLALLKQSVRGLNFYGNLVRLGTFDEVIFKHDPSHRLYISFNVDSKPKEEEPLSDVGTLSCNICITRGEDGAPTLQHAEVIGQYAEVVAQKRMLIAAYPLSDKSRFEELRKRNIDGDIQGFIPFLVSRVSPEDPIVGYSRRARDMITEQLSNYLQYVSSSRGIMQRNEPLDSRYSDRPNDVGVNGEKTMQILAYIRDDQYFAEVLNRFSYWASQFGLDNIIAKIARGPRYELIGRNKNMDVQSNVVDVGFGLNQLFPVILQCFYASKGSLVMIEQPEAHLHPKAQALIADFLIDVVNYGNRVMVETHSEHILLRLQRRVAEKRIDPQRIGIYYFEQTSNGTVVHNIAIDKLGNFSGDIPQGFFEEGFQEAIAHLKALGPSRD
jgi:hypothetical protein